MGLLATIIVGLIAGWLASAIMKTNTGILIDMLLGIVGAVVGGWIASLLHRSRYGDRSRSHQHTYCAARRDHRDRHLPRCQPGTLTTQPARA